MKLRTQRIHHMGASNRDKEQSFQLTNDVFEKSYIKSKSSYYKTSQSLPPNSDISQQPKTSKPFRGSNMQLISKRWDSMNKKRGKDAKWKLEQPIPALDYSQQLNKDVKGITNEFKGKDINLFKINQLKHTFVKNNRDRRHLKEYFNRFAKEGKIRTQDLQDIVQQYGYSINQDEAKIIFRLTGSEKNELNMNQFVELMSRDNVYFSTLKLENNSGPREHFPERIHLVFRNKFNKLMQAFKIYRSRGEPIDQGKFDHVMKKLDINDLVVSKEERQGLYDMFKNKQGNFNAEALFGAIIEQQSIQRPTFPPKLSSFQDNLRTQDQLHARNSRRTAYDFRRTPTLQFEAQFFKAQQVLNELKKLGAQGENLTKDKALSRLQLIKETQNILKDKGINFSKDHYDCYASYFNYNNAQKITPDDFKKYLHEAPTNSEARFDRRVRALAPLEGSPEDNDYDEEVAKDCLEKVRSKKLDPETKTVFKDFDKDKDGYLSRSELRDRLKGMAVLQNWQIDNLTNYFDSQGKGYVDYPTFAKKFDDRANQTDLNYYVDQPMSKLKSHSDWFSTKKSIIKDTNSYKLNIPSKYSAWPERLRHTDMSLIQPSKKAGQFISQVNRFNSSQKHDMGQQDKQHKRLMYQNKLKRMAAWNDVLQNRVAAKEEAHERRCQAHDYSLRLTKEIYQQNCHSGQ